MFKKPKTIFQQELQYINKMFRINIFYWQDNTVLY